MAISTNLSPQPIVLERISLSRRLAKVSTIQDLCKFTNKLLEKHGPDASISSEHYEDPKTLIVTRIETKQEHINRLIKLLNELEFHFKKENVELKRQRILAILEDLGS